MNIRSFRGITHLAVSCGKLFAFGGSIDSTKTSSAEQFQPGTDSWEAKEPTRMLLFFAVY